MLEGIGEVAAFDDGQTVFRENSPGREMFIIETGEVRLHRHSMREGGDIDTTIAVLGAGDFVGEMAVFDGGTRSAAATAVGEVRLRAISRKLLLRELRKEPDVALHFLTKMGQRIRATDALVEGLLARESLADDLYDEISALRSPGEV